MQQISLSLASITVRHRPLKILGVVFTVGHKAVPTPMRFLAKRDPTVPPLPVLSDGTPVYLYAVIRSSDRCTQPDANVLS